MTFLLLTWTYRNIHLYLFEIIFSKVESYWHTDALQRFWRLSAVLRTFVKMSLIIKSSRPVVFCRKSNLKIFGKFTRKHPRRSDILLKLHAWPATFTKAEPHRVCFPVNFQNMFRIALLQNTSGKLLPNNVGSAKN